MIGETISHYRVVSEIGAGGMGVVYKAEDLRLGRFVALKFLPQAVIRESDEKRRFFSEARAASALDHPNVCTIYDVEDLPDGRVFLAMAFCDGETLKQRLGRGPISPIDATRFAAQVASGLARAHHAGIVHRDVKPANIMVTTQGDVKLLDFGIAKLVGSDMTRTGTILGTIAYMSPEQARGAHVDERSDVWALGVTLYEMLAGNRPFTGADDLALLRAIAEAPVPPLAVAGVSPELAGVVARALDRDTSRRYANAGEMAAALDPLLHHAGTDEHAAYLAGGSTRRRFPGWAVAAVTAVAVAIGVAGVWAWRSGNARGARSIELAEVLRLADQDRNGEAFVLAAEAARVRAGDPLLESAWPRISQTVSVTTTPPGADVSFRLIGGDGVWHLLGRTPLNNVRAPKGIFEWRLEKAGLEALDLVLPNLGGPPGAGIDGVRSLAEPGTLPPGMVSVPVPPAGIRLTLTGFDYNFPTVAPSYFLDQHEVTNAEFQDFVEAGGYEERRYWTEPFVRDGRPMDWATAMTLFRDRTGPAGARDVGGRRPAGGAGEHRRGRRELVRSCGLRGVSGKAPADHLPLVSCRPTSAGRCDHSNEQFRWRRSPPRAVTSRPGSVRHARHGGQRQGVGVERHGWRHALRAGRRVERSRVHVSLLGLAVTVRSLRDGRISLHEGRRGAHAGRAHRSDCRAVT